MTKLGALIALAFGRSAFASYAEIAGYAPGSGVTQHAKIDLSAKAMSKFLGDKDTGNQNYDGSATTETALVMFGAAKDIYDTGCQSSSYVKFYFTPTANMNMANGKSTYTCEILTSAGVAVSPAIKFPAGQLKGTTKASSSYIQLYLTANMGASCGMVPLKDAAKNTYVAAYKEPTCPLATLGSEQISCTSSGSTTETARVASITSVKWGGRSLKGFSTGGAAKMDGSKADKCDPSTHDSSKLACEANGGSWTPSPPEEQEFVQAWQFHGMSGTYADDHVQASLNAMIAKETTGGAAAFSSCTTASSGTGATPATCSSGFVQGNALCKDAQTRALSIPAGTTFALQKTACEKDGKGKVTDFFSMKNPFNIETAKKMAVYANAWMYTLHEFEDGIYDCTLGKISNNDNSVHAWDEGVAFYTGSMAATSSWNGATQTGSSGSMIYALANKRCKNFGTCTEGEKGNAKVNVALTTEFINGQWAVKTGDCAGAAKVLERIKSLMRIPLIQGTLRYAYKIGELDAGTSGKEPGEGYAFMMSVIHAVAKCDLNDALTIYDALDMPIVDGKGTNPFGGKTSFADIKTAFENNYKCMGITCADVGELKSSVTEHNGVFPGAEACNDVPTPTVVVDDEDEFLPNWAVVCIAAFGVMSLLFGGLLCYATSARKAAKKNFEDYKTKREAAGN
jgi:hypothetical protein